MKEEDSTFNSSGLRRGLLIALGNSAALPRFYFGFQPGHVSRADLDRRWKFTATNASTEGHSVCDVACINKVLKSEEALHESSRRFTTKLISGRFGAWDNCC